MVDGTTGIIACLFATLAAALISGTVCVFADDLGRLLGVVDKPDGRRKIHPRATPLVGGLAVMLPLLAAAPIFAAVTNFTSFYLALFGAGVICTVLGFIDDRQHLRPSVRLLISVAVCIAVLLLVPTFELTFFNFTFLEDAIFLSGWGMLFTLMCLVGLQNAVNMADGKNGLVIGLSLIWATLLMFVGPAHLGPLLAALIGGLAVAFVFNIHGRLFLGDAGAYSISMMVGLLAIYVYAVEFVIVPADLVALWFLIPVVDCIRLMVTRIARGKSPFAPDRDHLHHLLYANMPWRWGLTVYLVLVGLPSFAATMNPGTTLYWALFSLACYGGILLLKVRQPSESRLSLG